MIQNRMNSLNSNHNVQNTHPRLEDKVIPLENLTKAQKKISSMNILVVEKLSIIVSGYFESMAKMRRYYQQIESLVDYNKRLIDVVEQFEAQEDKLVKRLKRMEEINVEYMREYCQVKGKQFKMPNIPEHKSIFSTVNLQGINQQIQKPDPPVISINYKNQLMEILKNYLNKQDKLLEKVEEQLKRNHSLEDQKHLLEIKQMIESFNSIVDQQKDNKPLELLRMRSQIRAQVQNFYDRGTQRQLKPEYKQEQILINKIINLHAKIEQMSEQALLNYLSEQKKVRNKMEKQRMEIRTEMDRIYKRMQLKTKQQSQELQKFKNKCLKLEKVILEHSSIQQQIKEYNDELLKQIELKQAIIQENLTKIKILGEKEQLYIQLIDKKQKQIQILNCDVSKLLAQIQELKATIQRLSKKPTLSLITWDILTLKQNTDRQMIDELLRNIKDLQNQVLIKQHQIQKIIQKYEEELALSKAVVQKQIEIQAKKQIQQYQQTKEEQFQKEINKLLGERLIVENLAVSVYQALALVSSMELNKGIKDKINDIRTNLERFIGQYQNYMEWNIMDQVPAYFKDYSMRQNSPLDPNQHQEQEQQDQMKGYSFDMKNLPKIKKVVDGNLPQPQQNKSFVIERIMDYSIIENKHDSLSISKQIKQMVMEEADNLDEYNNLRKLYQQAIECLEMEQKKTKTMELQYQKFSEEIMNKYKQDPQKYSLEKQLVYLTRLTLEQKETIETERKEYNEIFKQYHEGFKSKMDEELKSLRSQSFDAKMQKKPFL